MESARSLPDSPPGTDSSKSSPTFPTATTPALTPPKSPEIQRATHSASPPTAGSSPLPPLPNEVFLLILRHLPQPNRRRVRLVSRSWNSFLLAEPSLWGFLPVELLGGDRMEDWVEFWTSKASVNLNGKTNGGIRHLQVTLGAGDGRNRYGDRMHFQEVAQRLQNVLHSVEMASVPHHAEDHLGRRLKTKPSTLTSLKVKSLPNTMSSVHVLHGLGMVCRRRLCESLVDVDLDINVPEICLASNFLSMWPTISSLKLRFPLPGQGIKPVPLSNWKWIPVEDPHLYYQSLSNLRRLQLDGAVISRDLLIPYMPRLTHLSLVNLKWEGKSFFRLLRYVRQTLVSLDVADLELEDEETFESEQEEYDEHVDMREPHLIDGHVFLDALTEDGEERFEDPAPIVLRSLVHLNLSGNPTPPFFASLEFAVRSGEDAASFPTPVLVMPRLQTVALDDISTEQERLLDDSFGALATLGRNAPNVVALEITTSIATDDSIFHCLAAMSAKIERLNFYESDVSDQLMCKLVDLTPRLKELDVRRCQSVTIQSVARLVEQLRCVHHTRCEYVRVDPPDQFSGPWERQAYWWLDFVGVLVREPLDFEGDGPEGEEERKVWKVHGKWSPEMAARIDWEQKVKAEKEAAAHLALLHLATGGGNVAGGSGVGGSGGGSGSGSAGWPIRPLAPSSAPVFPTGVGWPVHAQQQAHQPTPPPRPVSAPPSQPVTYQQAHPTLDPRFPMLDNLRGPSPTAARMDTN